MKKTLISILVIAVLLLAYAAWPLLDLYRFARAAQARDVEQIKESVDFPAVRRSLAGQVATAYFRLKGTNTNSMLGRLMVGASVDFADAIVGKLVTPEALLDLLTKGDIRASVANAPMDVQGFSTDSLDSVWQVFVNSEYGLRRFWVRVPPRKPEADQFRLQLRLSDWRWRLVGLDIPEPLVTRLAQAIIDQTK